MKTSEIREAFFKFFESKKHQRVTSSELIPADDPTLLFTNAGMVQFKDLFLGQEKRSYTRATTCQKCIRISGKHNDLENVGRTARHHTFFEMLGNFSFGDYFKEDAINYAWEFVTEVLDLDKSRLWVTVFETDDEAEQLWKKNTDIHEGRIVRCGEKDNFWAMGETGPCGPCSEIFYFLRDDVENQSEQDFRKDDGSYIEIWNLVFMQFNRDITGKLEDLPKPSVDTGMGLERVSGVKQGVNSNYDTDQLRKIITFVENLCGKKYLGKDYTVRSFQEDEQYSYDVAMRVICDHARACSFLIQDGITPGSDGRGYVLRRLIRRACRYARILGLKEPFLHLVCKEVSSIMQDAYPDFKSSEDKIVKLVHNEEIKFLDTLENGLELLNKEIANTKGKVLSGKTAFKLHDTFGFPLDLTQDILKQHSMLVDKTEFDQEMQEQKQRSRGARAQKSKLIIQKSVKPEKTEFVGYDNDSYQTEVRAIYNKDGELKSAKEGDEIFVVFKDTPFYAESGGQVGDTGVVSSKEFLLDVLDTQKIASDTFVHICEVKQGEVTPGSKARLEVDLSRRVDIRVNHSATHLLHSALKKVLGSEVKQAGSRVSEQSLRFDFNHDSKVEVEQLNLIQKIVNDKIRQNLEIITEVLPIEEAKQRGATALFGEKYGEVVRVVSMGEDSVEFCGGTHASRTGDIGLFSILSESSVSSGVRRIEALSGRGSEQLLSDKSDVIKEIASKLSSTEKELPKRISALISKVSNLEQEIEALKGKVHLNSSTDYEHQRKDGVKVVIKELDKASPADLRQVADRMRNEQDDICILAVSELDGNAIFLTALSENLVDRFHAGKLIKEIIAVTGGKGGGRADLAQAGGGDLDKVSLGVEKFKELLE